jgi:hypothetical protein
MNHPLLELIALAVPHLHEVPNLRRRAEILEAAADRIDDVDLEVAIELRSAASDIRGADQAQLKLAELFSNHRA